MKKLQPSSKAFESYVYLGYIFANNYIEFSAQKNNDNFDFYSFCVANKNDLTISEKKLLKKTSAIDDSILIIDDILDRSKLRNGNPCLYLQIGEEKAIIKSKLLEIEARENLLDLATSLKTKEEFKVKIIKKFDDFLRDIYLGEQIDQFLHSHRSYDSSLIKKYFKMISLFTGGHVKYSIEIGQLLANKNPNPLLSESSVAAGVIRQIVDDFNDYYKKHHEPFGDFVAGSNRLPEILFKKFHGNKKIAMKLLNQGRTEDFLKMVLNKKVRGEIVKYCHNEFKIIEKNKHTSIVPFDDFRNISGE